MVMNVNDGPSFVRPQPMRNGFEISFFLSSICCFPRAVLCCAVLSLQEVTVRMEMGAEEVISSGVLVKPLSVYGNEFSFWLQGDGLKLDCK